MDPPLHNGDIALGCLELLKWLKLNPGDLSDLEVNRDVANLPELLESKVGSGTRYACGYWMMHIWSSPTTNDYVILCHGVFQQESSPMDRGLHEP